MNRAARMQENSIKEILELRRALKASAHALKPFAQFATINRGRRQSGDVIYAIERHDGTAELRQSDCVRAARVLTRIKKVAR